MQDKTQEGLAVASIARDDPSTLPGDDPFPRARMNNHRKVHNETLISFLLKSYTKLEMLGKAQHIDRQA